MIPLPNRAERRAAWVILILTFAAYAYFFPGADWNSMSHFATIRSLAERGTADISPFTSLTGDFTVAPGGVYSNKPPGLALLGTPIYFVLMKLERWHGMDIDAKPVWIGNLHVLAALLSALPAAILNVQLFYAMRREGAGIRAAMRREGAGIRAAMLLAGAFAFGSLSWPYSGTLMSHMLCASLVFAVWYLLSGATITSRQSVISGMLIGLACLCDLLIFPIAAIFMFYLVVVKRSWRQWLMFIAGPTCALLLILLYNRLAHGGALQSGAFHPAASFSAPGLLLGQFSSPRWRRIWWITFHPMRGLFICCPIFLFCVAALFVVRRPMRMRGNRILILLILMVYVAFYLTFFGWTGGWGVGLRYMIPVLALLWLFALAPAQRFPKSAAGFAAWSIFNMLAITSVQVLFPAPNSGPATDADPVYTCRTHLLWGELNQSPDSHNLASLVGVAGLWQLIPIFAILLVYLGYALLMRPHSRVSLTDNS
jgi:hypothetical protein